MAIITTAEYKGFLIYQSDKCITIKTTEGKTVKDSLKSLEACEIWIDNSFKQEKQNFKKVNAIFQKNCWSGQEYSDVTATSISDDGRIWCINNGKRSLENSENFFLDCEKNRVKIKEMNDLNSSITELHKQIKAVKSSLIPFDMQIMIVE